jgi:hypothetical protein
MPEPTDPSLITKAEAAFRQAAAKVVRQARLTGTPIIVWEGGEIRAIPPDEFQLLEIAPHHPVTPTVPDPE